MPGGIKDCGVRRLARPMRQEQSNLVMTHTTPTPRRAKIAIPVRVRGMSTENKFFDELTETIYVSTGTMITRLRSRLELDSEVHVTSRVTRQGGNFRAVWVNTRDRDGWFDTGLELVDVEGNIWGKSLEKLTGPESAAVAEAHLECQRCRVAQMTSVPEALEEFIGEGFTIVRQCEKCKGSTQWAFVTAESAAPSERSREPGGPEERRKGRAAIKMKIKVFCDRLGVLGEDVCETINVSANGLYFTTQNPYTLGEALRIVAPYEEGAVAIPVEARVVRLDRRKDSSLLAVAVELKWGEKAPGTTRAARPD